MIADCSCHEMGTPRNEREHRNASEADMKPTLHLDILFRPTDEGYEALFTAVRQEGFQQYVGDDWILVFDIPKDILFSELNHARLNVLYIRPLA